MKKLLPGIYSLIAVVAISVGIATAVKSHDPGVGIAAAENLLPSDTAEDWVTYGDHLVEATVTGQRESTLTQEEVEAGEGFIDRAVTFDVDQVLWSRNGARTAPKQLTVTLDGWTVKGDDRRQMVMAGQPLVKIGKRYLVLITYLTKGPYVQEPFWSHLSPDTIFPYDDAVIGVGDKVPGYNGDSRGVTTARDSVWKKSAVDLVELLESTKPDPAAVPFLDEAPTTRLSLVDLAKNGPPQPAPGEK